MLPGRPGAPSGTTHLGERDEAAGRVVARRRRHLPDPARRGRLRGRAPGSRPRPPRQCLRPRPGRRWTCAAPARSDRPRYSSGQAVRERQQRVAARRERPTTARSRGHGGRFERHVEGVAVTRRKVDREARHGARRAPRRVRRPVPSGTSTMALSTRATRRPRQRSAMRSTRAVPTPRRRCSGRTRPRSTSRARGGCPRRELHQPTPSNRPTRPGRGGRSTKRRYVPALARAQRPRMSVRCHPGPSGQRSRSVARRTANHSSKRGRRGRRPR